MHLIVIMTMVMLVAQICIPYHNKFNSETLEICHIYTTQSIPKQCIYSAPWSDVIANDCKVIPECFQILTVCHSVNLPDRAHYPTVLISLSALD